MVSDQHRIDHLVGGASASAGARRPRLAEFLGSRRVDVVELADQVERARTRRPGATRTTAGRGGDLAPHVAPERLHLLALPVARPDPAAAARAGYTRASRTASWSSSGRPQIVRPGRRGKSYRPCWHPGLQIGSIDVLTTQHCDDRFAERPTPRGLTNAQEDLRGRASTRPTNLAVRAPDSSPRCILVGVRHSSSVGKARAFGGREGGRDRLIWCSGIRVTSELHPLEPLLAGLTLVGRRRPFQRQHARAVRLDLDLALGRRQSHCSGGHAWSLRRLRHAPHLARSTDFDEERPFSSELDFGKSPRVSTLLGRRAAAKSRRGFRSICRWPLASTST